MNTLGWYSIITLILEMTLYYTSTTDSDPEMAEAFTRGHVVRKCEE